MSQRKIYKDTQRLRHDAYDAFKEEFPSTARDLAEAGEWVYACGYEDGAFVASRKAQIFYREATSETSFLGGMLFLGFIMANVIMLGVFT